MSEGTVDVAGASRCREPRAPVGGADDPLGDRQQPAGEVVRDRRAGCRSPGRRPTRAPRSRARPSPPAAGRRHVGRRPPTDGGRASVQAPRRAQAFSRRVSTRSSVGGAGSTWTCPEAASVNASSASSMWASSRVSVHLEHGVGAWRLSGRTSASDDPRVAQRPLQELDRALQAGAVVAGHGWPRTTWSPVATPSGDRVARLVAGRQPGGQPEGREQPRVEERADVRDLLAVDLQDLEVERREVALRGLHVEAERRLAVGAGLDHRHVVVAAGALPVDQLADGGRAEVPAGERRHLPDRLGLEQVDDRGDVLGPEGGDVLVEEVALPVVEVGLRRSPR